MNTVITILAIIVLVIVIIIAISGNNNICYFRDNIDKTFDKTWKDVDKYTKHLRQQDKEINPDIVYAHNVIKKANII